MEYCCHTWAGAPSCYLEILDITVGNSLAASLEGTGHRRNAASLKSGSHLPKKNYLICLIESPLKIMKNAFHFIFPFSRYFNFYHDFLVMKK